MILAALEGKPLPVYGDGLNERDWIHVEDHCPRLVAVLERGGSARPTARRALGAQQSRGGEGLCAAFDRLPP